MLRSLILSIIANAFSIYAVTIILPQYIKMEGGIAAFVIAGILIGILNTLVKPILKLITLPLVFLTGGLFLIIINALILFLVEFILDIVDIGSINLVIQGNIIISYLAGAFVLGVVNTVLNWLLRRNR